MNFLDEMTIGEISIKFWSGFDLQTILSHPKNGTKGIMVVLIESIDSERIKFERDLKLNKILNLNVHLDFDDLLQKLENKYLALYQSRGEDELLVKILKDKFHKDLYWQGNSVN